jgi:hypothetical protein
MGGEKKEQIINYEKFNIPTELNFHMWEQDINITRDLQTGYCDITDIRKKCRLKNFDNYKKTRGSFLNTIEKETGDHPIKTTGIGKGQTTYVHEKVMESLLRWYNLSETTVIDKFVHPDTRTVGQYKYNKVEILVHLESKYVNSSKFSQLFSKPISKWLDLKSTTELINYYSKHHKVDKDNIVRKGVGYNSSDVWIPQALLPMLAIWCSSEYALFVSEVMNMYHTDPMKMASMAIQEYDRQTGQHTVAVLHSTADEQEHKRIVASMQARIQQLKDNNQLVEYEKQNILMDNLSIRTQAEPFFALRDEHGITDVAEIALSRKKMLDKHTKQHDIKIEEKDRTIERLRSQLEVQVASTAEKCKMLTSLSDEVEELEHERNTLELQIENGGGRTRSRKPKKTTAKARRDALLLKDTVDKTNTLTNTMSDRYLTICSSSSPPSNTASLYTKREPGFLVAAMVPGKSSNFKTLGYSFRGRIHLIDKPAEHYIEEYRAAITSGNPGATDTLENTGRTLLCKVPSFDAFERSFTDHFIKHISKKTTASEYKIAPNECLCSY